MADTNTQKLITLENLATFKTKADTVYAVKGTETVASEAKTAATTNAAAISTLNGLVGSTAVSTQINTALEKLDSTVSGSGNYVTSVTQTNGKVTVTKGALPVASSNAAGVVVLGASGGAATYEAVNTLSGKVTTLVGSDSSKSVRAIAAEEVAKIVDGADEDYNTLKEMSDWIAGHADDVTAMNSQIQANTTAASNAQTKANDAYTLANGASNTANGIINGSEGCTAYGAFRDGEGNVIKNTYATQTALTNGLAGKANSSHNHASSEINAMTGYSKPSSTGAIATTDSLNAAIGKLEKALDGKQASGSYAAASHNQASNTINAMTGYSKATTASAIATTDSLNTAIGKLEKALDGKQASGSYAAAVHTHNTGDVSGLDDALAAKLSANSGSYIKQLSISGKTVTATMGDNTTVTVGTTQDTVYTHPTTAGNKHIPSGGSSGQILRWSASGTAVWGADNNTTYSAGAYMSLDGTTFSVNVATADEVEALFA